MTMTASELIEYLEDCEPDAPVHLAIQPSYPFEHSVARVEYDTESGVVYLAEGGQIGYLSGAVAESLGW